jgi:hypothetical protein
LEAAALDLSDLISDFIADRFNHLRTLFTVPQQRAICAKVKQLSTNTLADLTLSKLKNKPFQNYVQMYDFTECLEKIKEERLEKLKHENPAITRCHTTPVERIPPRMIFINMMCRR